MENSENGEKGLADVNIKELTVHSVNKNKQKKSLKNANNVNKRMSNHKINCMYTNADRLKNKLSEMKVRVSNSMPSIIGVTEVKPKNKQTQIKESEYSLSEVGNYDMFSTNIENDKGRGCLLYISQELKAVQIHLNVEYEEYVCASVKLNNEDKLLIGLVYRSPNSNNDYNNMLQKLLSEACKRNYSHILIMGDFNMANIDRENWHSEGDPTDTMEYKFIECLQDNYLFQQVTKPTRWRGDDTPHILDLVLTNEENMVNNIEYESPLGEKWSLRYNFYVWMLCHT